MTELDGRAEALTNAVYILRGYDDYDMADALHAAEWLRSGRQPFDDEPAEPQGIRIMDEVSQYSWTSRPLVERRNDPMPAEEMRQRSADDERYDVAHFDATVQEYRRELDQANRTIAALKPQLDLAERLYAAARAVVRTEDLQGTDDVVTYLRILVEQAEAAGWEPDDGEAAA